MFREFLSYKLAFVLDAVQYYRSIEFYLSSIAQGVYPLWDPGWFSGVSWDFFLRRIGNYNPFFLIILVLHKIGLNFLFSYLWFMAGYYFLGMIGFYLLLKRLIEDERAAFLGFLLLTFSSLGTMLFWSYIQLIFVPYFWFFFFLVAFTREPKTVHAWGLTFCSMVILTTYIPFYFVTILLSFLMLFVIIYWRALPGIAARYGRFMRQQRIVSLVCICCVTLSLIPGYRLYKTSASGEMSLPARQQEAGGTSMFTVGERNIAGGDITSQLYFDKLLTNHNEMKIGMVYVPLVAFLIFFLGMVTKVNRRMILLSLWAFLILLIGLTGATPVYEFLNRYVFYFKYIRQFYYFFWVMVLPVLIVLAAEQAKQLLNIPMLEGRHKWLARIYIFFAHAAFAVFFFLSKNVTISAVVVLLVSFIGCNLFLNDKWKKKLTPRRLGWIFLFLVTIQSLQTYAYVSKNAVPVQAYDVSKELDFSLRYQRQKMQGRATGEKLTIRSTDIYYCTRWFHLLYRDMAYDLFIDYTNNAFVLYDNVEVVADEDQAPKKFKDLWAREENRAIIAQEPAEPLALSKVSAGPQVITRDDPSFSVIDFNVNQIVLRTDFRQPRFLVHNGNYHSDWQAFINGKEVPIHRANVAFKGIELPAGANTVIFRFGKPSDYLIEYFYALLFVAVLCLLIFSAFRSTARST